MSRTWSAGRVVRATGLRYTPPTDTFRDGAISWLDESFAVVPELRPFGFETVVDLSGIGRIRIEVIGQDERPRSVEWLSAHRTWIRQLQLEGALVIAPTKAHLGPVDADSLSEGALDPTSDVMYAVVAPDQVSAITPKLVREMWKRFSGSG